MKQTLTEEKREIDKFTIIVANFIILLSEQLDKNLVRI